MKKLLLLIAVLLSITISVSAQEKKKDDVKPQSESVQRIRLANQLAKFGYETYSASALIEAAKILSEVETQPSDAEYIQGKGSETTKKETKSEYTPAKLIASAKEFADGDKTLLAMADKVNTNNGVTRGRVGGPSRTYTYVRAGSYDTFSAYFKYGIPAEVAISGDGDTDLDLYVYDQHGNLIASDNDYSDDCYVCWTPAWTGRYTIKVVNNGNVYNRYVIVTN